MVSDFMNIKLNSRYSVTADRYNWILLESIAGMTKEGKPKSTIKKHYYPRLEWCLNRAIETDAKHAMSLVEIKQTLEAGRAYTKAFEKELCIVKKDFLITKGE